MHSGWAWFSQHCCSFSREFWKCPSWKCPMECLGFTFGQAFFSPAARYVSYEKILCLSCVQGCTAGTARYVSATMLGILTFHCGESIMHNQYSIVGFLYTFCACSMSSLPFGSLRLCICSCWFGFLSSWCLSSCARSGGHRWEMFFLCGV